MRTINEYINVLDDDMRATTGMQGNYTFVNNGQPITLVAHIDTIKKPTGSVINDNGKLYRKQSILGADDRSGCFVLLSYLYSTHSASFNYLFTDMEESGGYGAKAFAYNTFSQRDNATKLYIEIDRHGTGHYATYSDISNSLELFLLKLRCGPLTQQCGTYSDIADISRITGVQSINLACGYYNEHTSKEYQDFGELLRVFDVIDEIQNTITYDIIGKMPERKYTLYAPYQVEDWYGQEDQVGNKVVSTEYLDEDYEEYEKWWNSQYEQDITQKPKEVYPLW